MVDSHSISVISTVFGVSLFLLSIIVILEYKDKHRKCHEHYDQFYSAHQVAHKSACWGDDVVFGSAAMLMISGLLQCLGAIPAWFNYWKTWSFFQVLLLLASVEAMALPFTLEGLEGFGGPEDIKTLILSGFTGIEFLFAFLSLFVMAVLRFQ